MNVRIEGVDGILAALRETAPKEARALMRSTVQQVAIDMAKDARARAPRANGKLKRSIKARRRNA